MYNYREREDNVIEFLLASADPLVIAAMDFMTIELNVVAQSGIV